MDMIKPRIRGYISLVRVRLGLGLCYGCDKG